MNKVQIIRLPDSFYVKSEEHFGSLRPPYENAVAYVTDGQSFGVMYEVEEEINRRVDWLGDDVVTAFGEGAEVQSEHDVLLLQGSFVMELQESGSDKWITNALRFETEEEGGKYFRELYSRWMACPSTHRVVPSPDPVNYVYVDAYGKAVPLSKLAEHKCHACGNEPVVENMVVWPEKGAGWVCRECKVGFTKLAEDRAVDPTQEIDGVVTDAGVFSD
jgi:hypothetical protein